MTPQSINSQPDENSQTRVTGTNDEEGSSSVKRCFKPTGGVNRRRKEGPRERHEGPTRQVESVLEEKTGVSEHEREDYDGCHTTSSATVKEQGTDKR